jgi:hypothetical protein
MELAVSVGIISAAVLVFIFFVEHLRVYEHPVDVAMARPSYDPATLHALMPAALAAPRRYSLALIVAAAVAVALLPQRAVLGTKPLATPVLAPRTIEGLALEREGGVGTLLRFPDDAQAALPAVPLTPLLMIDGNRDGRLVLFDHEGHEDRLGGEDSCAECHHMNLPLDRASSCYECHRDMYEPTQTFDHALHVQKTDGNDGCVQCHDDAAEVKTFETATACMDCHAETLMSGPTIEAPEDRWNEAVGYMEAMHELCIRCHERRAVEEPEDFPAVMQECRGCHDADHPQRLDRLTPRAEQEPQP